MDSVSQKIDIPIVNPSNKVWRDSTQTKTTTSHLQIGDSLRYTNKGNNEILELVYINTNDSDSTKYSIRFLRGNTMLVTKKFLKSRNVPYIGSIIIYS